MKTQSFYRVVVPGGTFSDQDFDSLKDARQYKQQHLDGLPNYTVMSDESREYWKKVGEKMKIYSVEQTTDLQEITDKE